MATVSGTVKDNAGAFACKCVRVYRKDTGAFVGEVYSNPTTGAWSITVPTTATKYVAIQHDDAVDFYKSNVVLACDFNSSVSDRTGKTITNNGVSINTTTYKFGSGAASFNGSSNYFTVPNSTDFTFPGDFAAEFFVRFSGGMGTAQIIYDDETASNYGILFQKQASDKIAFSYMPDNLVTNNSGNLVVLISTTTVVANTFYRVQVRRSGTTVALGIDGSQEASATLATGVGIYNPGGAKYFGARYNSTAYANIVLDDLRITKGVPRSFDNPTSAFVYSMLEGTENAKIFDNIIAV